MWNIVRAFLFLIAASLVQTQAPAPSQTDADEYTRYELLAPETASFRITYDVTATTAGARYYWNGIRRGSAVSDISVMDLASGAPLKWELVDAAAARANGFHEAGEEAQYIQITLARPVPKEGEARLRILKTYRDAKSYFAEGDRIVFDRSLSIPRNSVVLPSGYELIGVSYPSQIRPLEDGRIGVSFMNHGVAPVPYRITARKLASIPPAEPDLHLFVGQPPPVSASRLFNPRPLPESTFRFGERASQDREIVYYLLAPETSSFRLYHDYTESREGVNSYLNVVRAGSKASDPSATNLDTGESLKVETLSGKEARIRSIRADGDTFEDDSELVVIWFSPVKKGESVRLRIWETYTDRSRYFMTKGSVVTPPSNSAPYEELTWNRAFGRPRNAVVLPAGFRVTANSIPATVSLTEDGRVRLDYVNDRPDEIQVFIRARRR